MEAVVGGRRQGLSFLARISNIDGERLERSPLVEIRLLLGAHQQRLVMPPGFTPLRAASYEAVLGRVLGTRFEQKCLTCHGIPRNAANERGVQCESCHGPGQAHCRKGLTCTTCHNPHRDAKENDAAYTRACRNCHGEQAQGAFGPDLAGRGLNVAQVIKADVGLQVAFADVTGWDTHVNQGASEGQLAARLAELGQTLTAFAQDLGEKLDDVVVLTMSEFGRTVRENGNSGTDHGHATAMLVLGGPVNGGKVLGAWPGLDPASRFEGRDVAVTTDFRDLFAEVLARHLGARDLSAIFPGFTPDPARFPGAISA